MASDNLPIDAWFAKHDRAVESEYKRLCRAAAKLEAPERAGTIPFPISIQSLRRHARRRLELLRLQKSCIELRRTVRQIARDLEKEEIDLLSKVLDGPTGF